MELTKDNFNKFVSEISDLLDNNDSIDVEISVNSMQDKLKILKSQGKKIVLTYGTYDLLHVGHLNLLRRAKELGDILIVGISSDNFNKIKNKESYLDYKRRKMILENIKFVDFVFPEDNWEQKIDDIKKYNVNTFVMGDDWEGKFDELKEYCDVVYLPRTKNISTTDLKKEIQ